MAIGYDKDAKIRGAIIEANDVANQAGVVVINPDGSSIAGGGGSVTQYDEDTAHQSGDKGIFFLAVREDTLGAALVDANGDYSGLKIDGNGRLYVNNYASGPHDSSAANFFAQSTGSEAKDFDGSALPNAVNTEGDLVRNAASLSGVQYVMPVNPDGSEIADISLSAKTTGGTTAYKNLDVDESEDEIKSSAGQIYWIHCMNLSNSTRYLKFYNDTAANVTVGTTTPVFTFPIPTPGDTNGAGFNIAFPQGIVFDTAITVAATTGVADADVGAPGNNEVILNMGYK